MPNYIIAYHSGAKQQSAEEGAAHRGKWKAWIGGLGGAAVNPGTPLGKSKTVSSAGVSEGGALTGFSVVRADSMEAAVKIAQGCPYLDIGTVEVAEMVEMK